MVDTPRLCLRAITGADLPLLVHGMNDPDVNQYITTIWPLSLEDEEKWFAHQRQLPLAPPTGWRE